MTGKYTGDYKINDYSLLRVYFEDTKNTDFCILNPRIMNSSMNKNQYIEISNVEYILDPSTQEITGVSSIQMDYLDKSLWDIGGDFYNKHLNKYNGISKIQEQQITQYLSSGVMSEDKKRLIVDEQNCKYELSLNTRYYTFELYINQYYHWKNIYGIHIIVKSDNTGDTLGSYILKSSDFVINGNRLLYGGDFWLASTKIKIPYLDESYYFQITEITYQDINSDNDNGYVYNFPLDFEPFVREKPFPDNLQSNVSVDENFMIKLETKLQNYNGTIEEYIKEYFGIPKNELTNIQIFYTLYYEGINHSIDSLPIEQKILKVSNEYNTFDPIKIGLDIIDFIDYETPSSIFVNVITTIKVDDKQMTRQSNVVLDYAPTIVNLTDSYIQSTQVTSNEILDESRVAEITEQITVVNDQYIEKPQDIKIVQISKPVFIQMVDKDFVYEKKNVYFQNITEQTQLVTKEEKPQYIISRFTSDNKCYFDLSEIIVTNEDINYELIDINSGNIIGGGKILKKQL